jgi:hypothetical protein
MNLQPLRGALGGEQVIDGRLAVHGRTRVREANLRAATDLTARTPGQVAARGVQATRSYVLLR